MTCETTDEALELIVETSPATTEVAWETTDETLELMVETSPATTEVAWERTDEALELMVETSPTATEVAFETREEALETSLETTEVACETIDETTLDARLRTDDRADETPDPTPVGSVTPPPSVTPGMVTERPGTSTDTPTRVALEEGVGLTEIVVFWPLLVTTVIDLLVKLEPALELLERTTELKTAV